MKKIILIFVLGNFCQAQNNYLSIPEKIDASTKGLIFELSDTKINTEYTEIGTSIFMGKYIILWNHKIRHAKITFNEKEKRNYNNRFCLDIKKDRTLQNPMLFSEAIDGKLEEGSLTFSKDESMMYFTQESESNPGYFEIFKADFDENCDALWLNIKKIELVPKGYSVETPMVSSDGKTLFFASNMPGGNGGFDIYSASILENGEIDKTSIKNVGSGINTDKDEKYPSTDAEGNFYFSSKGHLNLGGYDVFKSISINGEYLEGLNLGTTLNSDKDEIAFLITQKDKGYVSTNNTNGNDFNILKFDINHTSEQPTPIIHVVDSETNEPIANAQVILKNENGIIVSTGVTNNEGKITEKINPTSYNSISVAKEDYTSEVVSFTSENTALTVPLTKKNKSVSINASNNFQHLTETETVTEKIPNIKKGYYLVIGVYHVNYYANRFFKSVQKMNIDVKRFYDTAKQYNYIYLHYSENLEEMIDLYNNNFNGRYFEEKWIKAVDLKD